MNRAFLNMKHEVKALVFRQTNAFMDPIWRKKNLRDNENCDRHKPEVEMLRPIR